MKKRLAFIALTLALIVGTLPIIGQIGQAQGSLQKSAETYFSEGARTIQAADLFENLNDGDPENDPYIISLRSAEDYAKGHVPGAVHMDVKTLFTSDNLATIPPDKDVVVLCYTGQTAGQATAALNMLGYEAYSLLHGMSSWTTDPEVFVKRFDPEKHTADYTIDTEAHEPGGPYELPTPLAGEGPQPVPKPAPQPVAELPPVSVGASNCIACHTDKPSLQALAVEKEVKSEKTSGEG
jgi:rhodanese-related sulfurtransferase